MHRDIRLQPYVTPLIAEWIRSQADERRVSTSIVIGDCIFDAWQRDTETDLKTPATDPVRQNVFITVALDALLTHMLCPISVSRRSRLISAAWSVWGCCAAPARGQR